MSKKYIEKNIIPKVKISDDGEILFNKNSLTLPKFSLFITKPAAKSWPPYLTNKSFISVK